MKKDGKVGGDGLEGGERGRGAEPFHDFLPSLAAVPGNRGVVSEGRVQQLGIGLTIVVHQNPPAVEEALVLVHHHEAAVVVHVMQQLQHRRHHQLWPACVK